MITALEQAVGLAKLPNPDWLAVRIDELTKKHADATGGGHYRAKWAPGRPWCCDGCRTINAALKELAEELRPR